eukprot:COSAG05_NODE_10232_length_576_cov_1.394130_1_plen_158_part_01
MRRLGAKLLADAAPWVEGRLLRHPERAGSLMGAEWVVEFAAAPGQTFTLKKQQLRRVPPGQGAGQGAQPSAGDVAGASDAADAADYAVDGSVVPEELVSPSQDAFALDLALPAHVEAVCRRLSRERSEAHDEAQAAYEVVVKGNYFISTYGSSAPGAM